MRVLVTWGSKRGGTEGIARMIAEVLRDEGHAVILLPARHAGQTAGFDAVIIGGALYANRWHPDARRFIGRQEKHLRKVPVWLFSSGPLDDSAERNEIAPTRQVRALMDRVGAVGHVTFGGRLTPDARGFIARSMAKEHAGDWRNPDRIRAWTHQVAQELPAARPGRVVPSPGHALSRVFTHAVAGWAACAAVMGLLLALTSAGAAIAVHAILAPIIFVVVAYSYFRLPGARAPLPVALAFTATVALLDAVVVAGLLQRSFAMFLSIPGTWLPLALIFLLTWIVGWILTMMPTPKAHAPA